MLNRTRRTVVKNNFVSEITSTTARSNYRYDVASVVVKDGEAS